MAGRPSLKGRVALAIALLVGFYVIALGLAAALLYIPYAEWVFAGHFTARLALFCVVAALAILRGIMPRRDKFTPPGPALVEREQPRLFRAIREVAAATGQTMPADVYLAPDVNAFVTERGGVMGLGSHRVMGIGLPLLDALTVAEFRAVVAHEFGHYDSGDTKLGPWVYKTRAAIVRTLETVGRHSSWLQKPFEWYGIAFSRITLAISRRQEFVADELAARTCGAQHLANALIALEGVGAAFGAYWQQEFAGLLERGFRAPYIAGFAHFRTVPRVREQIEKLTATQKEQGVAGPYDTHPSLKERLAALVALPNASRGQEDDAKAIALLDDVASLEAALLASLAAPNAPALAPIEWDDVPNRVLAMGWVETAKPSKPGLDGLTPGMFPEIATRLRTDPDALVRQLGIPVGRGADVARAHADAVLGSALALSLKSRLDAAPGTLRLTAPPGEPVIFTLQGDAAPIPIQPFSVLPKLRGGDMSMGDWLTTCRAAGIVELDLGATLRSTASRAGALLKDSV